MNPAGSEAQAQLEGFTHPIPLLPSRRARPSSYTRNPCQEVQQVLPVPRLLELALHGSGFPELFPVSPRPPQMNLVWLLLLLPAAALPPLGSGTVAAGMSRGLSPVSQNKSGRTFLVGEDGSALRR